MQNNNAQLPIFKKTCCRPNLQMHQLIFKIAKTINFLFLLMLLSFPLGLFVGLQNVTDSSSIVYFQGQSAEVFRDKRGVPTIIAENVMDLVFAQGYEFARDRLFQLEFYRSIINGELSRLFGVDLLETDIFLRTLGLNESPTS